ncbi:MAG: 3-deoxy-8-phosphooctulonate synthase [Fibrobacterota bacterium]
MKLSLTSRITLGSGRPLLFIAGPCVIESEALCLAIASHLARVSKKIKAPVIFKASFDKANRSSASSFRGPGLVQGLAILKKVKAKTGLPVLTDIHEPHQAEKAAQVVDVLQIPAFLCRQTDLLYAAADTGLPVNVKKGQFMAPDEVGNIIHKMHARGNKKVFITERGTTFGYHNLVVDMKGLPLMRSLGVPVIFDATHSVQRPASGHGITGGDSSAIPVLARAAAGAGVDGFFMEIHPNPKAAKSDAANTLPLKAFEALAKKLIAVDRAASAR